MKIKILAFGIAKDIVKSQSFTFTLQEGNTVGHLKTELVRQFPDFKKLISLAVAVNCNYVKDTEILSESDEVVLIPPVSGG